jgi:hypothetical protein
MQVKDVSLTKSMTVSIGGHSYSKVEIGLTATPDEDETYEEALDKVNSFINRKLAQEVERVLPKKQTLMESDNG